MPKVFFAALVTLSALLQPALSRADAFSDREALNEQRQTQNEVNQYWSAVYSDNVRKLAAIRQFAAAHSGLADDPNCTVIPAKCEEGSFCHGYGGEDDNNPYPHLALSSFDPRGAYYFESCKINLRNGLACDASLINFNNSLLEATCYDAAGNEKDFKQGGVTSAKHAPVRKKK